MNRADVRKTLEQAFPFRRPELHLGFHGEPCTCGDCKLLDRLVEAVAALTPQVQGVRE